MDTHTHTITGPTYPLLRRLHAAEAELGRQLQAAGPIAARMLHAHYEHAISDVSVVHRDGTWVGPLEQHQHLLHSHPAEYFPVGGGGQWQSRSNNPYGSLPLALCRLAHREALQLRARVAAAEDALGMATIVLAVHVNAGLIQWDTDESITRAAWRLCLAAAEQATLVSDSLSPALVWVGVLDLLDSATSGNLLADGRRYAQEWTDNHEQIRDALAGQHVEWGGRPVDRSQIAQWLGITESTWRGHVFRGQAPGPDDGDEWTLAAVSGYRIATRRGAEWWLGTMEPDRANRLGSM